MVLLASLPRSVALTKQIASILSCPTQIISIEHFPDGELKATASFEPVSGPVYLIQSFAHSVNESLMEAMLAIDLLRWLGQKEIVLIAPYLPYCRQLDASKLIAHFFKISGLTGLIGVNFHESQVANLYEFPVTELSSVEVLVAAIKRDMAQSLIEKLIVVAPDKGAHHLAKKYAEQLGVSWVAIEKHRLDAENVKVVSLKGDVQGKIVLLADDMCSTAGTLASAAKACREKGAEGVFASVTHGLFVGSAQTLLKDAGIQKLWTTDSCFSTQPIPSPQIDICVVPLAPLFAGCIQR